MEVFQALLDRLPNNSTVQVVCTYMPSDNEQNRLPATVESANITLRMNSGAYRGFLDWLRNDDSNTLLPMKLTWTGIEASISVDLDTEEMEVQTRNTQLLRACLEYSQEAHMRRFRHAREGPGRGRIVRRRNNERPPVENWGGEPNRIN